MKPIWWMYVLQNPQGQVSGRQVFIFTIKSVSDSIVLHLFGTRFHKLGSRYEGVFMWHFVVWILFGLKCKLICWKYGFLVILKTWAPVISHFEIWRLQSQIFGPWQIKFLVVYVHVLVFYITCSLTYFHIKIFVPVKQKVSYMHSSWTQTILKVKWIRWLFINVIANLFVLERLKKVYSEPSRTS